jgi:hypothetical protein
MIKYQSCFQQVLPEFTEWWLETGFKNGGALNPASLVDNLYTPQDQLLSKNKVAPLKK